MFEYFWSCNYNNPFDLEQFTQLPFHSLDFIFDAHILKLYILGKMEPILDGRINHINDYPNEIFEMIILERPFLLTSSIYMLREKYLLVFDYILPLEDPLILFLSLNERLICFKEIIIERANLNVRTITWF